MWNGHLLNYSQLVAIWVSKIPQLINFMKESYMKNGHLLDISQLVVYSRSIIENRNL